VIVDSPGFGESKRNDEMVMEYVPNAFAFIYVIDCASVVGVQKETVRDSDVLILKLICNDPFDLNSLIICHVHALLMLDEIPFHFGVISLQLIITRIHFLFLVHFLFAVKLKYQYPLFASETTTCRILILGFETKIEMTNTLTVLLTCSLKDFDQRLCHSKDKNVVYLCATSGT